MKTTTVLKIMLWKFEVGVDVEVDEGKKRIVIHLTKVL